MLFFSYWVLWQFISTSLSLSRASIVISHSDVDYIMNLKRKRDAARKINDTAINGRQMTVKDEYPGKHKNK